MCARISKSLEWQVAKMLTMASKHDFWTGCHRRPLEPFKVCKTARAIREIRGWPEARLLGQYLCLSVLLERQPSSIHQTIVSALHNATFLRLGHTASVI